MKIKDYLKKVQVSQRDKYAVTKKYKNVTMSENQWDKELRKSIVLTKIKKTK